MLCGHINCISHHGEINCIPGTLRTAAKSIAFNTRAKTSALLVHFVRRRRSQWHSTLRRNQVHSWKESLQTVLSQRLNAFDRYSAAITLRCLGTRVRYGACSSSTEPAYGAGTRRSFVRRCVWADSMEIKQPLQWCKRYDDQAGFCVALRGFSVHSAWFCVEGSDPWRGSRTAVWVGWGSIIAADRCSSAWLVYSLDLPTRTLIY
eukprot:2262166-Rhodomonas_salina.2